MRDPYERLRDRPTPSGEMCSCAGHPPIKLMSALTRNPIHCLDCNREIEPASLPLPPAVVDMVAKWCAVAGAIEILELDSGPYEYPQLICERCGVVTAGD